MTRPTEPELIEALRDPGVYAVPAPSVRIGQTHASILAFAGDRVYKIKKAVDLGFLDFSTLERRRHFCHEEVRLNRRLAGEVYHGVVTVRRRGDGGLRVGTAGRDDDGDGEVIDYAVEMTRLPDERMMDAMLARGLIDNGRLDELARLLADFHDRCERGPDVARHGAPEAVERRVRRNLSQARSHAGSDAPAGLLDFLDDRARRFVADNGALLRRRVREQRIREGHGDLHCGNICLTDRGIVIYDCIEFDRELRCCDVASDLAFLVMDLDRRGLRGHGGYLAHRYAQLAGDGDLESLLDFYKTHFACVRGKVAGIVAADDGAEEARREEARDEAAGYFTLAASYALGPVLLLMCGLPATGKSWIARRVLRSFEPVVLRSDVLRKRLLGRPATARVGAGIDRGAYAPEMTERVYAALAEEAARHLDEGRTVVVDATFSSPRRRGVFLELAAERGRPALVIHAVADEDVVRSRLARRAGDPAEASDAGVEVYERLRGTFQPPEEVGAARVLETRSDTSPRGLDERIIRRLIEGHAER